MISKTKYSQYHIYIHLLTLAGAHPTTKLCLDFIIDHVKPGDKVLDYGTGSGILSIMAAKLGASKCIGKCRI